MPLFLERKGIEMLLENKNAVVYGAGGILGGAVASSGRHRVPASHPKTIQIHATD
jgi:hypothetical protein